MSLASLSSLSGLRGLAFFGLASCLIWFGNLSLHGADGFSVPDRVDFNSHIKPLLSDRCFQCHGADQHSRQAKLRLDTRSGVFGSLRSKGEFAFVPRDLDGSVAWERINATDSDSIMPPPESNLSLSPSEKALIGRWIEQGAEWKEHWAFESIERPALPDASSRCETEWGRNGIDRFVSRRLLDKGLSPSQEAEKETLIRRVSFDLTGLPPQLHEIDAYLADSRAGAYERVVDRLLSSPAYAERMALEWMDVARYGDTQGMHGDRERHHWPWRDWVIKAFRENMPYDSFITWQLAGDLLPEATREQVLATAFHRNHPVSAEGGIIDEEFRIKYVQDRVNTTATAFLGLTLECATCHDHKFDPISQKDYYRMSAFFNNMKEIGMVAEGGGASGPVMLLPDPDQERQLSLLEADKANLIQMLDERRATIEGDERLLKLASQLSVEVPQPDASFPFDSIREEVVPVKGAIHRVVRNTPINKIVDDNWSSVASGEPELVEGKMGQALRLDKEYDLVFLRDVGKFDVDEPFSAGAWIKTETEGGNQTVMGISGDLTANAWRGWDFFLDAENRLSLRLIGYWPHNYLQVTSESSVAADEWHHVAFSYDGTGRASGVDLFIDGKHSPSKINFDRLYRTLVHPWGAQEGWPQKPVMVGRSGRFYTGENGVFEGSIDQIDLFNRDLTSREVEQWWAVGMGMSSRESGPSRVDDVTHFLRRKDSKYQNAVSRMREIESEKLALLDPVKEIMVLSEMENRRQTFVLRRGQYDDPIEEVEAGTPSSVLPFPDNLPKNRLGLARWLTDPKNPLTARVTVNRYWQMIFGKGIVETPHDFGSQGALPSHPELLDWLAVEFVESGWDIRALLRTMVTSATYRQLSVAREADREHDLQNQWLSRGVSYRLTGEMIRDNVLAASGLLVNRMGGASVKPYQPDGLWVEKTGPGNRYQADQGEGLYRRSLYTYNRRTTPHPAMIAFDAPNRSVCVVKRERTNTPLQALVLLNDPQFVEASRVLAERMQREGGKTLESQIEYGFRLLSGRLPSKRAMGLLQSQYVKALDRFRDHAESVDALLSVGDYPIDGALDRARTASLALVVNTMMNLDEVYSKR